MNSLSEHVGSRIRLYRKAKCLSLSELAAMINKSKSTISKYEQGMVPVDLDTLFLLAKVLNTSVYQLIDYTPPAETPRISIEKKKIFEIDHFYIYFYDGRKKALIRGYAEINEHPLYSDSFVVLYLGVDSFAQYSKCRYLYHGKISNYNLMYKIMLENQSNHMENLTIYAMSSLSTDDFILGHLCGVSDQPFLPVSLRCVLSKEPLTEDEKLLDLLKLNNEDLKAMKKLNMFITSRAY